MQNQTGYLCANNETLLATKDAVYLICYHILPGIFFVTSLTGQGLAFIVFVIESKNKPPYIYQAQAVAVELFGVIVGMLFMLSYRLLSGGTSTAHPGVLWFQKNYTLMWYTAHLAPILAENTFFLSLLTALASTGDRCHALVKPTNYNAITHKRRIPVVVFLCCVTFSVFQAVPDCFVNTLVDEGYRYRIMTKLNNPLQSLIHAVQYMRNVLDIAATALLVLLNLVLVLAFRKHNREGLAARGQEKKRRKTERMLVTLTFSQSVFILIPRALNIIYEIHGRVNHDVAVCYNDILAPILESTILFCMISSFYVNLAVAKPFRVAVVRLLITSCSTVCNVRIEPTPSSVASVSNRRPVPTLPPLRTVVNRDRDRDLDHDLDHDHETGL